MESHIIRKMPAWNTALLVISVSHHAWNLSLSTTAIVGSLYGSAHSFKHHCIESWEATINSQINNSLWQQSPLLEMAISVILDGCFSWTLHQVFCWSLAVNVQDLPAKFGSLDPSTARSDGPFFVSDDWLVGRYSARFTIPIVNNG